MSGASAFTGTTDRRSREFSRAVLRRFPGITPQGPAGRAAGPFQPRATPADSTHPGSADFALAESRFRGLLSRALVGELERRSGKAQASAALPACQGPRRRFAACGPGKGEAAATGEASLAAGQMERAAAEGAKRLVRRHVRAATAAPRASTASPERPGRTYRMAMAERRRWAAAVRSALAAAGSHRQWPTSPVPRAAAGPAASEPALPATPRAAGPRDHALARGADRALRSAQKRLPPEYRWGRRS
jgi:hypothetical protein